MPSNYRERFLEQVRNASMPANSGCCGKPRGCTMTHKGCRFLVHQWKRAMLYQDPTARCQCTSIGTHPETGEPVHMQCSLLNMHSGPCMVVPIED